MAKFSEQEKTGHFFAGAAIYEEAREIEKEAVLLASRASNLAVRAQETLDWKGDNDSFVGSLRIGAKVARGAAGRFASIRIIGDIDAMENERAFAVLVFEDEAEE